MPIDPMMPTAPQFGPGPMAPEPAKRPSIFQALMPIAAAFVAGGGRNPAAMGQGLAAFLKGKQLKEDQTADQNEIAQRRQLERAELYSRLMQQAQTHDDPVALEEWKRAMAPVAQVYRIPLDGFRVSDEKVTAKKQKEAREQLDQLRKQHGDVVDDPEWQKKTSIEGVGNVADLMAVAKLPRAVQERNVGVDPIGNPVLARVGVKPQGKPDDVLSLGTRGVFNKRTQTIIPGTAEVADEAVDLSKSGLDVQLVNAKRREARGEPGAAEDVKLIEETILKGDTLRRDPPRITVNMEGLTTAQDRRVNQLADAFKKETAVVRTNMMAEAVTFANSMSDTTTSPADDQALVYAFAKAMDPESVVREGEYATVQKYAQSWLSQFGFNAMRVVTESQFLTPAARKQLKATIRTRYAASKKSYDNLRTQYGSQINAVTGGTDGTARLIDYGGAFPAETADMATPPTAPTGGSAYERYLQQQRPK